MSGPEEGHRGRSHPRHGHGRGRHGEGHHGEVHHHDSPWGGPWGRRGWGGPPPWAKRARRGDVRFALLGLLAEQPMHGYDLIRTLEERSGGMWRPSPGSIYPTLQMLEEEGLISGEDRDGKRVYSITDDGRAELEKRKEQAGAAGAPWEGGNEMMRALRESVAGLAAAAMQVGRAGSVEQVTKTTAILAEARKKVYALLAES